MRSLERSHGVEGARCAGADRPQGKGEGEAAPQHLLHPPAPCPSAGSAGVWQSRGAAAPDLPASAPYCHSSPPGPRTAVVQKSPTCELASARRPRRLWASDAGAGALRQVTRVWSWGPGLAGRRKAPCEKRPPGEGMLADGAGCRQGLPGAKERCFVSVTGVSLYPPGQPIIACTSWSR